MFDILDRDDENENNLDNQQKWKKIEEEFNLNYQFDNTLQNMEEDDDEVDIEQEFIENQSITDKDSDDEVKINH